MSSRIEELAEKVARDGWWYPSDYRRAAKKGAEEMARAVLEECERMAIGVPETWDVKQGWGYRKMVKFSDILALFAEVEK